MEKGKGWGKNLLLRGPALGRTKKTETTTRLCRRNEKGKESPTDVEIQKKQASFHTHEKKGNRSARTGEISLGSKSVRPKRERKGGKKGFFSIYKNPAPTNGKKGKRKAFEQKEGGGVQPGSQKKKRKGLPRKTTGIKKLGSSSRRKKKRGLAGRLKEKKLLPLAKNPL